MTFKKVQPCNKRNLIWNIKHLPSLKTSQVTNAFEFVVNPKFLSGSMYEFDTQVEEHLIR